jgi:hypothetical protein
MSRCKTARGHGSRAFLLRGEQQLDVLISVAAVAEEQKAGRNDQEENLVAAPFARPGRGAAQRLSECCTCKARGPDFYKGAHDRESVSAIVTLSAPGTIGQSLK